MTREGSDGFDSSRHQGVTAAERHVSLSRAPLFCIVLPCELSQKFQKLFTRDAAESLWEHACRLDAPGKLSTDSRHDRQSGIGKAARRLPVSTERAKDQRLRGRQLLGWR